MAGTIGCGLIQPWRSVPLSTLRGSVSRTFDAPTTRVLSAARDSVDGFEITSEIPTTFDFALNSERPPKGVEANPDQKEFVIDPEVYSIPSFRIEGKTKDDQAVFIEVRERDEHKKGEVTILVGRHGDEAISKAYLDRVADRLAHPVLRTPEEAEKRKIWIKLDFNLRPVDKTLPPLPSTP
jgi:hypothetical protein